MQVRQNSVDNSLGLIHEKMLPLTIIGEVYFKEIMLGQKYISGNQRVE